jgi:hypothetical protein
MSGTCILPSIVLREAGRNTRLQAVNGECLGCGYRLAWIVIKSKGRSAVRADRRLSIRSNLHSVTLMTLFARSSTRTGIVSPICFAALRLTTNSNFVACCTANPADLPLHEPTRLLVVVPLSNGNIALSGCALSTAPRSCGHHGNFLWHPRKSVLGGWITR